MYKIIIENESGLETWRNVTHEFFNDDYEYIGKFVQDMFDSGTTSESIEKENKYPDNFLSEEEQQIN